MYQQYLGAWLRKPQMALLQLGSCDGKIVRFSGSRSRDEYTPAQAVHRGLASIIRTHSWGALSCRARTDEDYASPQFAPPESWKRGSESCEEREEIDIKVRFPFVERDVLRGYATHGRQNCSIQNEAIDMLVSVQCRSDSVRYNGRIGAANAN